ncbi:MAG: 16S rRNA (adenine(1518)-N(6)/adenine(1519)-N(6))-dimethyltransferase RsmA [Candidatus Moranbacteria bacterium]|nr:16S rRNA (adenine(1518)-N(6)/adenine(1519)-N(6))-dimethyltransferase RsmA [Candidatus Moranbacteria bacterium]
MPTRLGQNFLTDKDVVKKIITAANLQPSDFVLEIGPGKGILTEELVKKAGRVMAVELDKNLVELLEKKFSGVKNLKIVNADILKVNLSELFRHSMSLDQSDQKTSNVVSPHPTLSRWERGLGGEGYKVIANIPYYITAPIIRLFLESENPPQEMILMVQKEVAERIVATPKKMSLLAVSVKYYATSKILFPVSKDCFSPVPKIDSAVIRITHSTEHGTHSKEQSKKFFRVVKAGFSAKRKTLLNNLANSFHLDKKTVEEKLKTAGLLPTARAQELSIEDWKKLVKLF